jgi:RND family efflux transporter MFP subunit
MSPFRPRHPALVIALALGIGAVTAAVVAISQGGTASPGASGAGAATPPTVRVATAAALDGLRALELPARTAPIAEAAIHARATGLVAERRVDLGDVVREGDVLAVISAPEVDAALAQAAAEANVARAEARLAQVNRKRAEAVIARGAISQEALTTRLAEHERAVAARRAAEQNVARWQQTQGFQTVRAPFDGTITARHVERGDRVTGDQAGGATPLFEIARLDRLRAAIDVPPSAALQIDEGVEVVLQFTELPGRRFDAVIARHAGVIDPARGTMRVELELDNTGSMLPAGLVGKARLSLPSPVGASLVPTNAISLREGRATVATLDDGDVLRFVPVTVGRNLGAQVEVLAGLAPGTRVVLSPNALLKDGESVRVSPAPPGS